MASSFPSEEQLRNHFDLTRQEAIIARRLAAGESNKAISCALGISPHTARRHTERVFVKLGVRARSEVAARISGLAAR